MERRQEPGQAENISLRFIDLILELSILLELIDKSYVNEHVMI